MYIGFDFGAGVDVGDGGENGRFDGDDEGEVLVALDLDVEMAGWGRLSVLKEQGVVPDRQGVGVYYWSRTLMSAIKHEFLVA